ncbi:C40 family peptidase [Amphibiibacter pelophylacis]|uniref:C40 family peptidase n=1 Tax=Amphibiibacter pelophylacis TaxID=1799477 RepID=A0ACC6P3A6_9BURK
MPPHARRFAPQFLVCACLALSIHAAHAAPADGSAGGPPPDQGDAMMQMLRQHSLGDIIQNISPAEITSNLRDKASSMIDTALDYLGVPYRYGGTTARGFDCSGFTRYVFEKTLGITIPRTAAEQAHYAGFLKVDRSDLQPGDLVFFNTMRRDFSHVGIYLGDGKFVHSPRTGSVVRVDRIANSYWSARFDGARRATQMRTASASAPDDIAAFASR